MKLQVGDIIAVHGFIMLGGLDGGNKYRVAKISEKYGKKIYWFSKARGKKVIIGHYTDSVDISINELNNNRIEIIQ